MHMSTPIKTIGILLIILIIFIFFVVLICSTDFNREAFYCQPFSPMIDILDAAFG
jgi:hypothetical protein